MQYVIRLRWNSRKVIIVTWMPQKMYKALLHLPALEKYHWDKTYSDMSPPHICHSYALCSAKFKSEICHWSIKTLSQTLKLWTIQGELVLFSRASFLQNQLEIILFITAYQIANDSTNGISILLLIQIIKLELITWIAIKKKYHRHGGLKNRHLFLSSGDQRSKIKVLADSISCEVSLSDSLLCHLMVERQREKERQWESSPSWPKYFRRLHLQISPRWELKL